MKTAVFDHTGTITGIEKTSLRVAFDVALVEEGEAAYVAMIEQYGKTSGDVNSDAALIEVYMALARAGVTRDNLGTTVERCFGDGIIRADMLDVMVGLAGKGTEIYIVSKNPTAELNNLVEGIGEYSKKNSGPSEVIAGFIGVDLKFDDYGKIIGVNESITDGNRTEWAGIPLANKANLVQRLTKGSFHFVSDESDLAIAKMAVDSGKNAVLIRYPSISEAPQLERDIYFRRGDDYQKPTFESKAYNNAVPFKKVKERLPILLAA